MTNGGPVTESGLYSFDLVLSNFDEYTAGGHTGPTYSVYLDGVKQAGGSMNNASTIENVQIPVGDSVVTAKFEQGGVEYELDGSPMSFTGITSPDPVFVSQPVGTLSVDGPTSMTVNTSNATHYSIYKVSDGSKVGNTLAISNDTFNVNVSRFTENGSYELELENRSNATAQPVRSDEFVVDLDPTPVITSQPLSLEAGATESFSLEATGADTYNLYETSDLTTPVDTGAFSGTLVVNLADFPAGGEFVYKLIGAGGKSVDSDTFTVTK